MSSAMVLGLPWSFCFCLLLLHTLDLLLQDRLVVLRRERLLLLREAPLLLLGLPLPLGRPRRLLPGALLRGNLRLRLLRGPAGLALLVLAPLALALRLLARLLL